MAQAIKGGNAEFHPNTHNGSHQKGVTHMAFAATGVAVPRAAVEEGSKMAATGPIKLQSVWGPYDSGVSK